jgi:PiT family inorganic phosphate transporter
MYAHEASREGGIVDIALISLIGLIALALLFDYTNGFHDSANSVATVIATRVLRPRWAVLWAAIFNFVAFMVFGTAVADTVGSTVKGPYVGLAVVFAALLGAITWNYASWHLALPTSSSQALIGGLVGAGLATGLDAIEASSVREALIFMFVSPLTGLVLAAVLMTILRFVLAGRDVARTERGFRWAQLASSAAVSLGHGGNDAQKTMGVIAALLVATGHLNASGEDLTVPLWVAVAAAAAIALGTFSGGWRIVRTMGSRITRLRPVSGFSAETAAATALSVSTAIGAPVSTTQTVAGAITGVGAANAGAGVNWRVLGRIAVAWVVTMPTAALIAALLYRVAAIDNEILAGAAMGAYLLVLATLVIISLRRAPRAADVEDMDVTAEREVPLRTGAGSIISPGAPAGPPAARTETEAETGEPARRVDADAPL